MGELDAKELKQHDGDSESQEAVEISVKKKKPEAPPKLLMNMMQKKSYSKKTTLPKPKVETIVSLNDV